METTSALLIFPHQLFAEHPGFALEPDRILLIEDPLFFGDPAYPARFHKQKLAYHRTTMGHFQERLEESGWTVERADYRPDASMLSKVIDGLAESGLCKLTVCDVHDYILERRLRQAALDSGLELNILASPGFLNTPELNQNWRKNNSSWFMASFYKWQRRRLKILVNDSGDPAGGKWSFR